MGRINQVTTRLDAALDIDDIRTSTIIIEDNMLITDLNYYSEEALVNLYNRVAGGYLSTRPEIGMGQLSYALVPGKYTKPVPTFAYPE